MWPCEYTYILEPRPGPPPRSAPVHDSPLPCVTPPSPLPLRSRACDPRSAPVPDPAVPSRSAPVRDAPSRRLRQGLRCDYLLCRLHCRDKCYELNLDCLGHRITVKTKRQNARDWHDRQRRLEAAEAAEEGAEGVVNGGEVEMDAPNGGEAGMDASNGGGGGEDGLLR